MESKNKNNKIESQILYHCAAWLNPGDLVRSLGHKCPLEEGMVTHGYSFYPEESMVRGAWQATVHELAKSRTD